MHLHLYFAVLSDLNFNILTDFSHNTHYINDLFTTTDKRNVVHYELTGVLLETEIQVVVPCSLLIEFNLVF